MRANEEEGDTVLDRGLLTLVGHGDLRFWNPVSPEIMDGLFAQLPVPTGGLLLDVGCGRGELLLRLLERNNCRGLGYDPLVEAIAIARQEAKARLSPGRLELLAQPFEASRLTPESVDVAACVGATHAISNYRESLRVLRGLVRPGGVLLVGEGYWKQRPDPRYLSFLGCSEDDLFSHRGNIECAQDLGLELLEDREASAREWALYEDTYARNLRRFVRLHPGAPQAPFFAARVRRWRKAYLTWGRDTLGFGLYLLRRSE